MLKPNFWFLFFYSISNYYIKDSWVDFEKFIFDTLNIFYPISIEILNKSDIYYDLYSGYFIKYNCLNDNEVVSLKLIDCIFKIYWSNRNWSNTTYIFNPYSDHYTFNIDNISILHVKLYDELRNFTRILEIYCSFIDKNQQKPIIFSFKSLQPIDYIVNFNYTSTFIDLYREFLSFNDESRLLYIHGKASLSTKVLNGVVNKDNLTSLVLGTQKFNISNFFGEETPIIFNKFQKFFQRKKFNTLDNYHKFIAELEQLKSDEQFNIFVIGIAAA